MGNAQSLLRAKMDWTSWAAAAAVAKKRDKWRQLRFFSSKTIEALFWRDQKFKMINEIRVEFYKLTNRSMNFIGAPFSMDWCLYVHL